MCCLKISFCVYQSFLNKPGQLKYRTSQCPHTWTDGWWAKIRWWDISVLVVEKRTQRDVRISHWLKLSLWVLWLNGSLQIEITKICRKWKNVLFLFFLSVWIEMYPFYIKHKCFQETFYETESWVSLSVIIQNGEYNYWQHGSGFHYFLPFD